MWNRQLKEPSSRFMKQCAFTLAEVLITLGIIGVVAAMTIPTLMNKTNDAEMITAWKKAYTTFSQAYLQMQTDGNATWDLGDIAMRDAFAPYFKVIKKCDVAGDDCWHSAGKVKSLPLANGTQYDGGDNSYLPGFLTQDGMKIIFQRDFTTIGWIMVDVNGDKKPNFYGKDIFGMRFDGNMGKSFPFPEAEMGTCNPPVKGSAGNWAIGLGCSTYYLYTK